MKDSLENDNEGHVDTRHFNHGCENPDPKRDFYMEIDIAG